MVNLNFWIWCQAIFGRKTLITGIFEPLSQCGYRRSACFSNILNTLCWRAKISAVDCFKSHPMIMQIHNDFDCKLQPWMPNTFQMEVSVVPSSGSKVMANTYIVPLSNETTRLHFQQDKNKNSAAASQETHLHRQTISQSVWYHSRGYNSAGHIYACY